MEFNLVHNLKDNCHHDHIPFNFKRNGNIVFLVYARGSERERTSEPSGKTYDIYASRTTFRETVSIMVVSFRFKKPLKTPQTSLPYATKVFEGSPNYLSLLDSRCHFSQFRVRHALFMVLLFQACIDSPDTFEGRSLGTT